MVVVAALYVGAKSVCSGGLGVALIGGVLGNAFVAAITDAVS